MFSFYSVDNDKYNKPWQYQQNNDTKQETVDYANVTIPLGKKSSTASKVDLSDTSILKQKQTQQQSAFSITGLSVEKQSEASKKTTAETATSTKTETKESTTPVKKGPTVNETLTKFYGEKFTNASPEDKEKMVVKYFDWLSKEKKGTISQLDQFKLYRDRSNNDQDYKLLSSVIDKMEAQYQYKAAKVVVTEGTNKQKYIGQTAVAGDIHHYDKSVQLDVTSLIVGTKNTEAINIAAGYASKLNAANQIEAVKIYQTADINDFSKKALDRILINQYSDFAKENQVGIHKIMSNSKFSETVEYAASNIYKLDKQNQADAYRYTASTGNEKAIKAADANTDKYDDSAKAEIIKIANEKREIQHKEYEARNNSSSDNSTKASNDTSRVESIKEAVDGNESQSNISEAVKNLNNGEKMALLTQCPTPEVIKAILDSNPSLEVLAKIDVKYLQEMGYKNLGSNIGFLNASAQTYIVKESAFNGSLSSINRSLLLSSVKCEYDNLLKEENKKKNV